MTVPEARKWILEKFQPLEKCKNFSLSKFRASQSVKMVVFELQLSKFANISFHVKSEYLSEKVLDFHSVFKECNLPQKCNQLSQNVLFLPNQSFGLVPFQANIEQ